MSSPAYRLRRADGNGASVECSLVSPCRLRLVLFLSRFAFAIARSVIGDIRPVSRIVGRGGRAGRLCLLAVGLVPVVGSFFSYSSHQHLLGRGHSPVVSSCLLRLVRFGYCSACGRGRSSPFLVRRHVGTLLLASCPSYSLSPPSRSSCRPAARFTSLCHSPRFATRRAGSCFAAVVLGWLVARSRCLSCVGRDGVSAWRVIIIGRSRRGA